VQRTAGLPAAGVAPLNRVQRFGQLLEASGLGGVDPFFPVGGGRHDAAQLALVRGAPQTPVAAAGGRPAAARRR
jgi:hypothetical protein